MTLACVKIAISSHEVDFIVYHAWLHVVWSRRLLEVQVTHRVLRL